MAAPVTMATISATPEAREALRRLQAQYGPVMFHTSGGRVGGRSYPICLPADALRLGARDYLLGKVDGVPVYEMEDVDSVVRIASAASIVDVATGPAIGFSFDAGPGKRFTLRPAAAGACREASGDNQC